MDRNAEVLPAAVFEYERQRTHESAAEQRRELVAWAGNERLVSDAERYLRAHEAEHVRLARELLDYQRRHGDALAVREAEARAAAQKGKTQQIAIGAGLLALMHLMCWAERTGTTPVALGGALAKLAQAVRPPKPGQTV